MSGRVVEVQYYSRASIRANPTALYVFGDNMAGTGLGGQAKECRGEPNVVGIPTKWRPTMEESAFFRDGDLEAVKPHIQEAFRKLSRHLAQGGMIIWPRYGVGTGLADLPRRAPAIAAFIDRCRAHLECPPHPLGDRVI
ncbi:DUF7831 domain-containing protein [Sphingomonas cannabina]